MSTQTGLINRALVRIGKARIASFEEQSPSAQAVRDIWNDVRQSAIRAHPWNFAIRRTSLSPVDGTPPFGWTYRFRKPAAQNDHQGWLRTLGVYEDADEAVVPAWDAEGPYILADVDLIYLRFVADITNVSNWDPLFAEALSLKLASELAVALANSSQLHDTLGQLAERAFARARAVDGMDGKPIDIPMGTWEQARFGDVV